MGKSAEFHQKMVEGWATAREAKDRRRAENRAKWSTSRKDWADERSLKAEIPVDDEALGDDRGSPALAQLRIILADIDQPLYRRVEVGEIILGYELGPGAAAGADPETVVSPAYQFFQRLIADAATPENLRLRALRQVVAVEAHRASLRNTSEQLYEKHALLAGLANAERKLAMVAAHAWPPEPDLRWALDVGDVTLPSSWLAANWPPQAISGMYRGVSDEFRAMLRGIRGGESDTFWERFPP